MSSLKQIIMVIRVRKVYVDDELYSELAELRVSSSASGKISQKPATGVGKALDFRKGTEF